MQAAAAMQPLNLGSSPPPSPPGGSAQADGSLAHRDCRLAQRRSRERERAEREQQQEEAAAGASGEELATQPSAEQLAAEAMAEEMAALRLENSQLAYAASLMEKTLEFRQAVVALAQTLHVAPALPPPPAAKLLPGSDAAIAAAHQRVVAAAEQLPPQHDVEAFAARFAGQLPDSIAAVAAAPSCALPAARSGQLLRREAPLARAQAAAEPAAKPAGMGANAGPGADNSTGCLLEEGGGDSSGKWVPAVQLTAAHALCQQPQQQPQQAQQQEQPAVQPWQRVVPSDGWGVPGIPLAIGGGRPAEHAPSFAQRPHAPAVQPLLLPPAQQPEPAQQPQPQPQSQLPDDPGDGWGPRGAPLLLGGGSRGRSCVLAQVLATCQSQAACSEVFSAEGRALQAVGVPPPSDPAIRRRVEAIQDVAGILRLQRRLLSNVQACWPAAEAARFARGSPARQALEEAAVEMSSHFWHLAMLKPHLLNAYMLATLPPPSKDMSAQWHNVALDSMPLLAEGEIDALRDAYQRYAQRMALAAVGVRPIAQKLQALAGSSTEVDLAHVAARHTQVGELASHMHSACEQQYLATMGLLLDMQRAVNPVVRAFWRIAAGNCTPDHPAILSALLLLHQEQQERLASPASSAGSPRASCQH